MKPYDAEKAKAGHHVCTRDGRDVEILKYDMKGDYPIGAVVSDTRSAQTIYTYASDGAQIRNSENKADLFMKHTPVVKEVWAIVTRDGTTGFNYSSKKLADAVRISMANGHAYIYTRLEDGIIVEQKLIPIDD